MGLILRVRVELEVAAADEVLGGPSAGLGIRAVDTHEPEVAIEVDELVLRMVDER